MRILSRRPAAFDEPGEDRAEARMTFLEHLEELRVRLIRSLLALVAATIASFVFVDRIADFVMAPTLRVLPPGSELVFTKPGEAFSFYLDIALIAGVILAMPFITYQVWRFIAPGLYSRERRFVVPFLLIASTGTLAGAAFGHYVLYPGMMEFFATFKPRYLTFLPRLEDTFDLYKNTMIGMVLVFQMPTLVYFLAKMRLVTAGFLWRHFKYAILGIFIIAAVLTPSTDWWNQTMFAAPMVALYVLSIGIAWLVAPRTNADEVNTPTLRLVFVAVSLNHALRQLPSRSRLIRSA
jgi:sec-independent protein translocase protein TatC